MCLWEYIHTLLEQVMPCFGSSDTAAVSQMKRIAQFISFTDSASDGSGSRGETDEYITLMM